MTGCHFDDRFHHAAFVAFSTELTMQDSFTGPAVPSLVGKLLVASTSMRDPILSQAVAMVVEHHERRISAVLLNRPISTQVHAAESAEPRQSENGQGTTRDAHRLESAQTDQANAVIAAALQALGEVHFGGPLASPMLAICGEPEHGEFQIGPGVYGAVTRQTLAEMAIDRPEHCRILIGALRWGPAELEQQLEAGLWHLADAQAQHVWQEDQWMWQNLLPDAMAGSMAQWVGLPQRVSDSSLN